jgi:2-keto-4-pentenoate hydratase
MIRGAIGARLMEAANLLLDARRSGEPIVDLPAALQPVDLAEAYFVQDAMAEAFGPVGGWKIGAATAEATPVFAPMPKMWIAAGGAELVDSPGSHAWRYRGLEAEIAFLIGEDLPPRATPYSREEVMAAIASCHPAIEVLESGLVDPVAATKMSASADMQIHGGFVYGAAYADWKTIDFSKETVMIAIDGSVRVERTGSNTSGDLMRLLPYLANEGAARTGGLKAGDWITTGSWTGNEQAVAGSSVDVRFGTAGRVGLRFG